ncbi:hypothetical protein SISNIDRAFT_270372 [Sistotremastrum niveocremeum HHB9708]|uniref:Uncharacterized protein n=2 Tax=Sistotremastraceae TaxID=3402574 RepID=A0A164NZU4_9AGAM|nr:hypothetical protein SISNIDRAFT_270372 [Sistotremastrum niveocremeum HHB9708]KZT36538.1 hypothetical protein SISSUDRAFT_61975 [Sistotremastrum suecicum HHB10207 ss-3]
MLQKRKAQKPEEPDNTQLVVYTPFGPRGRTIVHERDASNVLTWLGSVFGKDNILAIYAKKTDPNIIIEVPKELDVDDKLGAHPWSSFLDPCRPEERHQISYIFKFNWSSFVFTSLQLVDVYPHRYNPPPRPRIRPQSSYPPAQWAEIPKSMGQRSWGIALPESRRPPPPPPRLPPPSDPPPPPSDEPRGEIFIPYRSLMSRGLRELIGIDGMASSEDAQSPTATIVKKEEQEVKREPFEASLPPHFRNPDMEGNTFFVLFDPVGFDPNRPYDLSLVVAWLEHPFVFGPNSIESFWGRILDNRIIVQFRASRGRGWHHLIGEHHWNKVWTACPPARQDRVAGVYALKPELRSADMLTRERKLHF